LDARALGEIHPKIEDEYKIFHETFKGYENLFREESESLRRYVETVPIVCDTELELITRFEPQIAFVEVGIGRSDIREIAERINVVYLEFKYEGGDYESALIDQLVKIAHSHAGLASRAASVIGNTHLKPAKRALGEAGFHVNCVTVGNIVDEKEKRRIRRAFRIIRKMLDAEDLSYSC
jgi:hypothetical protein